MSAWVDVGAARRAMPQELECGDDFVIVLRDDAVLIAVIDGLGHGPSAAAATAVAVKSVGGCVDEPLPTLIHACHLAMRRTRGAVMSVARLERCPEGARLTWAGVGNVDGVHVRADGTRDRVLALGGIVGHAIGRVLSRTVTVGIGELVALATDGLRSDFAEGLTGSAAPAQAIADRAVADYARATDDACIVVARVVAGS